MKKLNSFFLTVGLLLLTISVFAQTQNVSGTVTDQSGDPVIAATVRVTGTDVGTVTDLDGNFSLQAPQNAQSLTISYVGMQPKVVPITGDNLTIALLSEDNQLEGVVVTAMGISREKESLGYATQSVGGNDVSDVKSTNFADALSGEVAGLDIQSYNSMGGSANIVTRGYSSLYGNNQALIVIDGTPVTNTTSNTSDQTTGRGGADYGNAAMDINPDDIESVNVLKSAAATALYGSRASNGAIIITTKKGSKRDGIGINFSSSASVGNADSSTLPKYQNEYGAGYGPYYGGPDARWDVADVDGDGVDDLVSLAGEDASYGPAFDPDLDVYHWYNLIPGIDGYLEKEPFVAAPNKLTDFLKSSSNFTNSFSLDGGSETTTFRLGYTNLNQKGILPNSKIDRNTVSLNVGQTFTEKLSANLGLSYIKTDAVGRYGTGYDNKNVFQSFRQWAQVNADIEKQRQVYSQTGENYSWNMNAYNGGDFFAPHYFDNPYWMRDRSYNNDNRNRYIGNASLNYEVLDGLNFMGRVTLDSYEERREDRIDVGSVDVSEYELFDQQVSERNYDIIGTYNKQFTSDFDFASTFGWNLRVQNRENLRQQTNGGLISPGLFNFDNSVNPLTPADISLYESTKKVDGIYGQFSFGFADTYYLEATARSDRSSALPKEHNRYFYPSISSSMVYSNVLDMDWLDFGKIRANYAQVGNDLDPYNVYRTYTINPSFGGQASASNPSSLNNYELKAEKTKEWEIGTEMLMFDERFSVDFSYYNRETEDLLTPVDVSTSSGVSAIWLNSGSVSNKGMEIFTRITPVKTDDFKWDVKFNWAKNRSKVLSLYEGIDFLQLAGVQGGVSIGAKVGEPFGVIRGRDYVYNANGQREIYSAEDAPSVTWAGMYKRTSSSNNVLGDINPDWTGGVKNNFSYKNFNFSFLIDMQKGGDVFSLDTYYGYATGLYDFTVGTNDLGNPIRNSVADGGGIILEGVNADGNTNTTRAFTDRYSNPWGYARTPTAAHVWDASFVKLRELTFGYDFPSTLISDLNIQGLNLSFIARNPWIISKNVPYSDPEAGLSAGNIQGNQSGAYPSVKEFGASLNVKF